MISFTVSGLAVRSAAVQLGEISRSILITLVPRELRNLLTRTSVDLPDHFLATITLKGGHQVLYFSHRKMY